MYVQLKKEKVSISRQKFYGTTRIKSEDSEYVDKIKQKRGANILKHAEDCQVHYRDLYMETVK